MFQFRVSGSVPSSREVLGLRKRRWAVSQRGREGREEPRRCCSSSEVAIGAGGCGPGGRRCSKCVCPARGLETSGLMLKEHPISVNRAIVLTLPLNTTRPPALTTISGENVPGPWLQLQHAPAFQLITLHV